MDIDLTGKTISFPKVCSCCGDPTTATRVIGSASGVRMSDWLR